MPPRLPIAHCRLIHAARSARVQASCQPARVHDGELAHPVFEQPLRLRVSEPRVGAVALRPAGEERDPVSWGIGVRFPHEEPRFKVWPSPVFW